MTCSATLTMWDNHRIPCQGNHHNPLVHKSPVFSCPSDPENLIVVSWWGPQP